jgi:AcrR family transcriptional regulator
VSEITRRAGISKGAFYLHFDTKDRAFEEVTQDFFNTLHLMISECDSILDTDRDVEALSAEVLALDVRTMDFLWNERHFARILFQGAHSSKHIQLIEAFAYRVQTHLEGLLAIDVRRGRLAPDTNIPLFAAFLAGGWDRYARGVLTSETRPDIETDVAALHAFTVKGLFLQPGATFESQRPPQADFAVEAAQ